MRRRRRRRSWFWRYRRLLFLLGFLASTALAGAAYLLLRVPLPPANPQAQTTVLTDVSGARLASLDAGEDRVSVPLERVPKVVVDAVLATEDKGFFKHGGVDPSAVARATWADVRGKPLQGGSTLTQQYVKNVYLPSRERTLWRKIREGVLAIKLERKLKKEEILERYLNTIYFGRGAYGVQAASRAYFGKDVGNIGLREASYLAGLIRSPEEADALRAPEEAGVRRSTSLAAMERLGLIVPEQRAAVEAEPVASYLIEKSQAQATFARPEKGTQYFVEYVRQQLVADYGPAALYSGGLRVRTSMDLNMQAHAYDSVYSTFLNRPDDPAGSLVAIDDNGYVRAMVGGRDWNAANPHAKVNLAVGKSGGGTGRQPGSAFKPFVLAEAVRQGYTVESAFPGPARVVFPGADKGRDYTVENFDGQDFGGSVNLIDATRNSVNTVYAQLIQAVGPARAAKMAHEAGITSPLVENLSLTLGTSEVSVLEIAGAYTTFANRGQYLQPTAILEVTTTDGRVLRRARPRARTRVLDRKHADIVNFCLQQVVERGSGTGAQFGKPAAGKTGTTQDYGDAWFVGYTPKLTVGVWMGFPEGNARKMTNVRGRSVNGGSFPAAVFRRFMQAATKNLDTGSFPKPADFPGRLLSGSGRVRFTPTTTPPPPGPAPSPAQSPASTVPPPARPAPPRPATTTTAPATRGPPPPPPSSTTSTVPKPGSG